MISRHQMCVAGWLVCLSAAVASAQRPFDLTAVTLEDLLDAAVVSSASRFPQQATQAPASVTIVDGDEIRTLGYRTLAEVLGGVRGLYTSYDRNYHYLGVRGHAPPGGYNNRVLLLVDGHRLNETTYDVAPVGTDFPVDVSLIERIEVIRGPGSSLYGTNAFFAVINVITTTAGTHEGVRVEGHLGSLGTRGGSVSVGHVSSGGLGLLLAASYSDAEGPGSLYYPEFDVPGLSTGIVTGADGDTSSSVFGVASLGSIVIRGALASRAKQVPTGAYGTAFGADTRTVDTRAYTHATWDGRLGAAWNAQARLGFDYYHYEGTYPYDYGPGIGLVPFVDGTDSVVTTGDLTLTRRIRGAHRITTGGEVRRVFHSHLWAADDVSALDVHRPTTIAGVYVQDEITVRRWMLVNAGVRIDHHGETGASAAPRTGIVLLPRQQTAIKLLHGRAFRAPNAYELHYYSAMRDLGLTLQPERVATSEVVWEEYLGTRARTSLSVFRTSARNLVELRATDDDELYFANRGATTAQGVEAGIEGDWMPGVTTRLSHTYVRAVDAASGHRLSNAPRHLSQVRVVAPVAGVRSTVAIDARVVSRRFGVTGNAVPAYTTANLASTTALARNVQLRLGVYNLLDRRYADPGGAEHVQPAIAQDGRTFRLRVVVGF